MKERNIIKYFFDDENNNLNPKTRQNGIDKLVSDSCNMKSGDLSELCFEILFPEMKKQVKLGNHIFDFVDDENIYEIKNYMYESTGTADEKLLWSAFKYVDALSNSKYKRIYIVLCAKFELLYESKYKPKFKNLGLLKILNDMNIYFIFMSDLINNFYYTENENSLHLMSFIKWVGGKSKLLYQIYLKITSYPNTTTYLEPFLGSGSVLINLLKAKHDFKNIKVNDINKDLITTFQIIKTNPTQLIYALTNIQKLYCASKDKEKFYYKYRDLYNNSSMMSKDESYDFLGDYDLFDLEDEINLEASMFHQHLLCATLFIFLNKTCFRGLYRVNKQNLFNVPFGNYVNPSIINPDEIIEISKLIQKVEFYNEDYKTFLDKFKTNNSIIYLDPPYFGTFNGYSSVDFNHDEFVNKCLSLPDEDKNIHVVISNSKPFYDKFENVLNKFKVEYIDIKDRINSKSPNDIRNEVLLSL